MPLDMMKVFAEIRSGLACVCATCENYWEGRDRGSTGCAVPLCCGPMGGKTFPKYRGPMTDFSRFCFVCSGDSDYTVHVVGEDRVLGVCASHVSTLDNYDGVNTKPRNVNIYLSGGGISLPGGGVILPSIGTRRPVTSCSPSTLRSLLKAMEGE